MVRCRKPPSQTWRPQVLNNFRNVSIVPWRPRTHEVSRSG
jgi:hypothetical protein